MVETENNGSYHFEPDDFADLNGYTGVITLIIVSQDSYYIDEEGFQPTSEVYMRFMNPVTTIIE